MPISTSIRGPAPPTVSLTVAIAAESGVRGRLAGELGAWGQAEGCVLQISRALATDTHWLGPGLKATEPLSYPRLLSPPQPPNGRSIFHGWWVVESSATGVYGHCH